MNKAGEQVTNESRMKEPVGEPKSSPEMNELMERLLKGEEFYETVETDRGTFKLRYLRPRLQRAVQVLLANRFAGQNLNNIPASALKGFELYALLDVAVVEAPKWWDKLETSEDCPDEKLVLELYRRYLRFYNSIQQKIGNDGSEPGESDSEQSSENKKKAVDTGAFQGIANG